MSELKEYLCVEALVSEKKEIPGYLMHMAKYRAPQAEMELVYLKSEADKVIAELEESHKKEVEQLLMEIVELKEKHKKEVDRLLMKIAGLEKLVETADKLLKPKGGFTVKDITFNGVKLEVLKKEVTNAVDKSNA